MTRVQVALGVNSYDLLVEHGLVDRAAAHLAPLARGGRLLVVSDENVWAILGRRFQDGLAGVSVEPILILPGEQSKSWDGLRSVIDRLLAHKVERSDHLLAFGGGVVGDLAGFAAAIVNRGCHFVQIPTTLLAQVDSSVGGKTAINVDAGKISSAPSTSLRWSSLILRCSIRLVRASFAPAMPRSSNMR